MSEKTKTKAYVKRKKRPTPIRLKVLSQMLTEALVKLEDYMLSLNKEASNYGEELRRTAHSLATIAGTYLKSVETSDFEERLETLQRTINELQSQHNKAGESRATTETTHLAN